MGTGNGWSFYAKRVSYKYELNGVLVVVVLFLLLGQAIAIFIVIFK